MRLFFAPPDTAISGFTVTIADVETRSGGPRNLIYSRRLNTAPAGCYDVGDPRSDLDRILSNPEASTVEQFFGFAARSMRGKTIREVMMAAFPQTERLEIDGILYFDQGRAPKVTG